MYELWVIIGLILLGLSPMGMVMAGFLVVPGLVMTPFAAMEEWYHGYCTFKEACRDWLLGWLFTLICAGYCVLNMWIWGRLFPSFFGIK